MGRPVRICLNQRVYWARRDELNLTNGEVALRAGIGKSSLTQIISCKRSPRPATRRALQEVLRLPYHALFEEIDLDK
jgi:transcriptional regulator with XRE-family HTH domain